MSLTIWLATKCCSECGHSETFFTANMTHNVAAMAEEAGVYDAIWYPDASNITTANELISPLENAVKDMMDKPDKYKALRVNEWGTYEDFLPWLIRLLVECRLHPDAEIGVSRQEDSMNKGIDYSMGMSNVDKSNGIHYGVISQNEVMQAWCDSSEPEHFNGCPHCGNEWKRNYQEYKRCPHCHKKIDQNYDFSNCDPVGFVLDDGEYKASCGEDGDIFILKSPYYTTCQFCSPYAPGAGYIMNTVQDGVKAYCFGHDWFDNEKAPYPVYSVETGKLCGK